MSNVAVVGSAKLDLVIEVGRPPEAGETVLGSAYSETPGGKGLNQATASARITTTSFIGAVGTDTAGKYLTDRLLSGAVGIGQLRRVDLPTGRAIVVVTPEGENSIIVLPMANSALQPDHVGQALTVEGPSVVMCQLEIPIESVAAAESWCVKNDARFILNPSPVADIPPVLLNSADPLVLNRTEAEELLGAAHGLHTGSELAQLLAAQAKSVVVTGGSSGAWVVDQRQTGHIPGLDVPVKDTTGAGDTFTGTLAAHLALGAELIDAVTHANAEAARIVQLDRLAR
ncbi:ribokinase [Arthrobacter sp. UYEF20]|uniref:ribokinase n=1 Tax=Arthrobacter sp. UYEF20 TaxID=1756363 RepID=UPI0033994E5E